MNSPMPTLSGTATINARNEDNTVPNTKGATQAQKLRSSIKSTSASAPPSAIRAGQARYSRNRARAASVTRIRTPLVVDSPAKILLPSRPVPEAGGRVFFAVVDSGVCVRVTEPPSGLGHTYGPYRNRDPVRPGAAHLAAEMLSIAASTLVRNSPEIGAEPATSGREARCWPSSEAT